MTALVLGGGGVTGVAWMWGMLAGLAAAGTDVRTADLVVGTSAGSLVGAQVANGIDIAERYEAQQVDPTGEPGARMSLRALTGFGFAIVTTRDPVAFRTRIGRMALAADTEPEVERRKVFERLPVRDWPADRRLLVTAVDAHTGDFVVYDRDSGVPLIDAVAASCAVPGVWPPVTIGGRRMMDGGIRSAANADLAAGQDPILILAPLPGAGGPMTRVGTQAAELRRSASVLVLAPDAAAKRAIGRNVLDPAARAPAARAGYAQATTTAPAVAAVWG
jgi:NTE family protein